MLEVTPENISLIVIILASLAFLVFSFFSIVYTQLAMNAYEETETLRQMKPSFWLHAIVGSPGLIVLGIAVLGSNILDYAQSGSVRLLSMSWLDRWMEQRRSKNT